MGRGGSWGHPQGQRDMRTPGGDTWEAPLGWGGPMKLECGGVSLKGIQGTPRVGDTHARHQPGDGISGDTCGDVPADTGGDSWGHPWGQGDTCGGRETPPPPPATPPPQVDRGKWDNQRWGASAEDSISWGQRWNKQGHPWGHPRGTEGTLGGVTRVCGGVTQGPTCSWKAVACSGKPASVK